MSIGYELEKEFSNFPKSRLSTEYLFLKLFFSASSENSGAEDREVAEIIAPQINQDQEDQENPEEDQEDQEGQE